MATGSVIGGKADPGVMVKGPVPDKLNTIVSNPGFPFASSIACRKQPAPLSATVVTVKTAATAGWPGARNQQQISTKILCQTRIRRAAVWGLILWRLQFPCRTSHVPTKNTPHGPFLSWNTRKGLFVQKKQ
jgi:hypothetical protein